MKFTFAVVNDNGSVSYITAKTKTEAIDAYCRKTGCPKDYVKRHCLVKKI